MSVCEGKQETTLTILSRAVVRLTINGIEAREQKQFIHFKSYTMAKANIDGVEYAFNNAVDFFKVVEKLSNKLADTFILSLTTGYPVNVSSERITVIQYLKECQENKETAFIYSSKESLQRIF